MLFHYTFVLPRCNKLTINQYITIMKDIQIKCNTKGEVNIDDNARIDGISIALVNEKQIPVARYEISIKIMSGLTDLKYRANNCRIHFYGNDNSELTPTMKHEVGSFTNCFENND